MTSLSNIDDAYSLTGVQQGLLFHSVQSSDQDDYLAHITVELHGSLDVDMFKKAWHDVLQRHPTLRSSFAWEGMEVPLQVIHSSIEPQWQIRNERGVTDEARSNIIAGLLRAERSQRIDLTQAPLSRFQLVRWTDTQATLVWSIHHLVSDGGSTPIVFDEVIKRYSGYVMGKQPGFPAVNAYKDFVNHELSRDKASAEAYWREYLGDITTSTLNLPSCKLAPAKSSPTDNRRQHSFTATQSKAIGQFCQEQRITLSALINGAWAQVLGHHSNTPEPTFGVVMSGRSAAIAGLESSVGLFVKTLPLKTSLTESRSMTHWLQHLQQDLHKHTLHDHLPLHSIQKISGSDSQQALFDTVVALQSDVEDLSYISEDQSLTLKNIDHYIQSHYPVSLLVIPGAQLRMTIVFNPDHVEAVWAQQILNELVNTIEAILANPHSQPGDLNELVAKEHLVSAAIGTRPDHVRGYTGPIANKSNTTNQQPKHIVEWFNNSCESHSLRPALITDTDELSYAELHTQVISFASVLSESVSPKSLVALHINDKASFIVAVFATMMAGCTYLPIDPNYPTSRKTSILNSANADAIISDSDVVALSGLDCQVLQFQSLHENDRTPSSILAAQLKLSEYPYSQEDEAYVLYTSGSSGAPKGVAITHNNLVYSTAQRELFYKENPERFLMQSSFSFDSSVVGLYWTLLNGGALILPSNDQLKNIPELATLFEKHRITHTLSLPSIHQLLLESADAKNLDTLKTVIVAGESLTDVVVKEHFNSLPDCALYNEYGPTECTVWSSAYQCQGSEQGSIPIGYSPAHTPILIVDSGLKPCIAGVVGEILIGGPGVARGYKDNRYATRSAFVQSNYEDIENEYWYRTGDRGYIAKQGELVFLGRLDTQIKFRGQRIELSEIDAAIDRHTAIARSVTVLKPADTSHPAALICFYECHASSTEHIDADDVITLLRGVLPSTFIPSQYIALDRLPALPNGKVDRRKLEQLATELEHDSSVHKTELPEDETEKWVVQTVSNILGTSSAAMSDNFFKLGGDSFNAMRMTAQIHTQFGINIGFNLLLNCTTLKDLATLIRSTSTTMEPLQPADETFESGEI